MEAGCTMDSTLLTLEAYQSSTPESTIGVPGGEWRFRESATAGPVLLMLPGAQGTGDMFYKTALMLGGRYRVITATPPAWPDCERIAASLAEFVDALALSDMHLLGSSLSGYTVQLFARDHAARIRTLFLANTFCDAAGFPGRHAKPGGAGRHAGAGAAERHGRAHARSACE